MLCCMQSCEGMLYNFFLVWIKVTTVQFLVCICSIVRNLPSHWLYTCKWRRSCLALYIVQLHFWEATTQVVHCAFQIGWTRVRGGDHSGEDGSSTSFPSTTTIPLQMLYCSISVLLLLQYFSISVPLLWHYAEVHYHYYNRIEVSDPMYIVIQQILLIITSYCSWYSLWQTTEHHFRHCKYSRGFQLIFNQSLT